MSEYEQNQPSLIICILVCTIIFIFIFFVLCIYNFKITIALSTLHNIDEYVVVKMACRLSGFCFPKCLSYIMYSLKVSLVAEYSPELSRNDSFKDRFVQTIHSLYLRNNILAESKLRVKVTSVSEGSVLVAFDVTHTNYTEAKSPSKSIIHFHTFY